MSGGSIMRTYNSKEIREKANIVEIAEKLGIEVKANKCKCFFPDNHSDEDSTPSMTFNIDKGIFKCWVCDNVGGTVIDLVMSYNNWSYPQAMEWLGQELGLNSTGENNKYFGKKQAL